MFLQQFQIIIARPMGAIISKCCQQSETTTIIQSAPRPTKKKPNIVHQQQQSIKTKQQIPQRPKSIPQVQQQQFFEIQSFIEEREKSNLQPPKLTFDDFEINGKLGEGSFGVVLQVQLKQQRDKNINYAMKRIGRDKMKNRKIVSSVHLQRNILASASHSFITSLKYAFADKHSLYLVMESAGGGDVSTLINHPQRQQAFRAIRTKGVQFITACTILALQYLHSHNIIYRDLKTQNILIFSDGYVKLSDFGLAKIVNSEDELSKTHAGTALYTAPQVVLKSGYKKSVDLWALGVLIYELATGETPFKLEDVSTKLRFKRVCQQEQKLRKWRGHQLDSDLKDLVGRLLKFNPQDRLGVKDMQQIKNHTYFKGFNWQHLVEKSMQSPLLSIIQSYPTKIQSFQNKRVGQQNFSDEYDSEESWDFNYNLH